MRMYSTYYTPRNKAELIKGILPKWSGSKTDLRQMGVKQLRAIFHRIRQETIAGLMRK